MNYFIGYVNNQPVARTEASSNASPQRIKQDMLRLMFDQHIQSEAFVVKQVSYSDYLRAYVDGLDREQYIVETMEQEYAMRSQAEHVRFAHTY